MTFKNSLAACCAVATLASSANAALTSGLVGYFDFESDFTNQAGAAGSDVSGTFVNGTSQNGAIAGASGGISGNAMELRSTGGTANEFMNVTIGYGGSASTSNLGTSFTISAWYKLDSPPAGSGSSRYFVYEGQTTFDASYGIRDLNGTDDTTNGGINDGQFFNEGINTGITVDSAGLPGWHHVVQVYTFNGTTTDIANYVDGVQVTGYTGAAGVLDSGINFGASRSSVTNRGFDGKIDEVGLWSRSLSSTEVAELYSLGLSGQSIPEPSATALIGLAGIGFILRRRR